MRKLLAANLTRLRKNHLFWGILLLEICFALFRIYTSSEDIKVGYQITLDEILFTYIMITGLVIAVFISVFLGTEYHDGTIRNKLVAGHSRTVIYLANLTTVCLACLAFTAAYILIALVIGTPVLGPLTLDKKQILATFLGTLVLSAAFCALYTFIAMSCSHKTASAIICILLFFAMMCASTYIFARLDASPEHLVYEMIDGEFVSHLEPNARYLQGTKREIYTALRDILPTGQATQYVIMSAKPLLLSLYSAAIFVISTVGGLVYFRRKDIK